MLDEEPLVKVEMIYLKNVLSLSRKEFNRYIINYKKYLIVIAEKLRSKIINLIYYIYKVEKRLRD